MPVYKETVCSAGIILTNSGKMCSTDSVYHIHHRTNIRCGTLCSGVPTGFVVMIHNYCSTSVACATSVVYVISVLCGISAICCPRVGCITLILPNTLVPCYACIPRVHTIPGR